MNRHQTPEAEHGLMLKGVPRASEGEPWEPCGVPRAGGLPHLAPQRQTQAVLGFATEYPGSPHTRRNDSMTGWDGGVWHVSTLFVDPSGTLTDAWGGPPENEPPPHPGGHGDRNGRRAGEAIAWEGSLVTVSSSSAGMRWTSET